MGLFVITGGRFLDPRQDELVEGVEVLVEDAIVREVSYGGSIKVAGELVPGAFADLLVVDGDPYRDLGVFRSDGDRVDVIMANGVLVTNRWR